MRRPRYILLTLLATPCILLLLVSLFCYARSYRQTDDIFCYTPGRMTRFRTSGGGFSFETRPRPGSTATRTEWGIFPQTFYPFAAAPGDPLLQRLGFLTSTRGYDLLFDAPWWFPTALLALPSALWAWATARVLRRRREDRRGLCPTCSYDLRAHAPGQKCPECGTVIAPSHEPSHSR